MCCLRIPTGNIHPNAHRRGADQSHYAIALTPALDDGQAVETGPSKCFVNEDSPRLTATVGWDATITSTAARNVIFGNQGSTHAAPRAWFRMPGRCVATSPGDVAGAVDSVCVGLRWVRGGEAGKVAITTTVVSAHRVLPRNAGVHHGLACSAVRVCHACMAGTGAHRAQAVSWG